MMFRGWPGYQPRLVSFLNAQVKPGYKLQRVIRMLCRVNLLVLPRELFFLCLQSA
jgi:hypothetical protein